jgi:chlorobactene lauroyltransferase
LIRSHRIRLFESLFSMYIVYILKRHFFRIHVSADDLFEQRDAMLPTIICANHSSWWDGFVMLMFAHRRWRVDSHLMMDIKQMRRYRFFRWLGVFSVDRDSARSAVESIGHAAELLTGTGKVLWIFPQGILLPNDARPIRFYQGVARIIEKLGRANLLCMAMRYEFRGEQRPEIFVRFSHLQCVDGPIDPAVLTASMRDSMECEVDALRDDLARGSLEGFAPVLFGRRSRNSVVDRIQAPRSTV